MGNRLSNMIRAKYQAEPSGTLVGLYIAHQSSVADGKQKLHLYFSDDPERHQSLIISDCTRSQLDQIIDEAYQEWRGKSWPNVKTSN